MTTATLTAALPSLNILGFLKSFSQAFVKAKRFETLFAMNDAQLKSRGLDRDMLVRSYISGLSPN